MNENIVGTRIGAFGIDALIWLIVFVLFSVATSNVDTTNGVYFYLDGLPFLIYIVLALAYHIILEASFGGTVGKLVLGITVVNNAGDRLTLKQSFIRNIMRFVDGFPYVIPYFVGLAAIAASPTKQRLGDRVAGTYVVRP